MTIPYHILGRPQGFAARVLILLAVLTLAGCETPARSRITPASATVTRTTLTVGPVDPAPAPRVRVRIILPPENTHAASTPADPVPAVAGSGPDRR